MQQYLAEIVQQVWHKRALILVAEPGSGKTTLVPWALSRAPSSLRQPGQILVLEPRRLAARMAARYVAHMQGEAVGGRVGYRVRHEDVTGPNTELVYMTEGLLWRSMLTQRAWRQVACVVFDEFHGRSITSDLILAALVQRRQQGLASPAIVVMSATLAHEQVQTLLPEAQVMHVPGRQYPVTVQHVAHDSGDRLESQVARGVAQVLQQGQHGASNTGHILAFLPGKADIERAATACARIAQAHDLDVAPLHASLPPAQQDKAVSASARRRLILATNVAETSLTIEGVTQVIDSGLAKIAEVDAVTGIGRLQTGPISQAAAVQRAGRAGRTAPGHCLRLYTAVHFKRQAAYELPEILRQDLAEAVLWLCAQGLPSLHTLPLIDRPTPEAIAQAEATLLRLGAWRDGEVTELGQRLLALPVHPRLGRMVLGARALGITDWGCRAAAVLSLGHRAARSRQEGHLSGHSDLEPLCAPGALDGEAKQVAQSLKAALRGLGHALATPLTPGKDPMELLEEALLLGFSDRLARRLPPLGPRPGALPLALGWGGKGVLAPSSCVRESTMMLALAAGQRGGHNSDVTVDVAHGIAPESLLALDDGRLQESVSVAVSPSHGRVEKVETLMYDGLVVHESRSQHVTPDEAHEALHAWVRNNSTTLLSKIAQDELYEQLIARLENAAFGQDLGPLFDGEPEPLKLDAATLEEHLQRALLDVWLQMSASCRSVGQVQQQPVLTLIMQRFALPWRQALQHCAPTQVVLASGRRVPVHYVSGQAPYVASYMQDFFGSPEGPTLGAPGHARRPLTLHLWGPNKQPVQVTQDLANFWQQHYPKLRGALARRYPKHVWPSDPVSTPPPPPRGRR